MNDVKVWTEDVVIPTYAIGKPEKNPMFLEKRVYQGSSGVVYPHPVVEKISDEKTDQTYQAVFLENAYIKMMVLPQLGGRIQMAYDKVKQRHFVYYNQVIKPALVGLTGPWISGGIEFNWPQHHRPSTFDAVDFTIEENADGSKTIWVNEVERMFRTKGMAGFTLHPNKAYIEIKGKLYNRTPFPQTFLWWANPAVKVNDDYQSIFPPDVYAVFDHGKRDVSAFPIAKGTYYKVDYAPGTDISKYKNIPVPTSYMAITSKYNFIGGYEHDTEGGLLHVANHHISPGKKQWTWGHGDFGKAWDKNLTDEDGPYIELMTGVFTDNQPDFSWLNPYEQKTFEQYFMPYREVGVVNNATKEAVLGVVFAENDILVKLHVTGIYNRLSIRIFQQENVIHEEEISSNPEAPFIKTIAFEKVIIPAEIKVVITNLENNKILLSYQQDEAAEQEIPAAAQPAKRPADVENNEQLYLTGLHIEQYRHATYIAKDYYEEALRRDEKDVRNNNAMGLWYLRRGKPELAEPFLKTAVKTLTQRNPNPYCGEAYYNLGWSLKMQGKYEAAYDAFYKSVWNDAQQHAGYLNLARIAVLQGNTEEALELIDKSLVRNYHSHTARHLKVVILRKLGKTDEAFALIEESLQLDRFNFGCLLEQYLLLQNDGDVKKHLHNISRNWVHNFIEYAFDYAHAGLYSEAAALLQLHIDCSTDIYPMVYYYLGWFESQSGNRTAAKKHYAVAAALSPDFCFPNRIEDVAVLSDAMLLNSEDAKAPYYLGNFWYDKRQYDDAITCWESSVAKDVDFATVHRNLSLAYFNKANQPEAARKSLENAFALDTTDARILMELDQLYKKLNTPLQKRLDLLEEYLPLVATRDDLYLERLTIYNQLGKYAVAKKLIAAYKFHPWEGGEGKVVGQYLIAHIELAKEAITNGNPQVALDLLDEALQYPDNLGEGKLYGTQENDIFYLKAMASELSERKEDATAFFEHAASGISEPAQAIFYNDPQPDKILYQSLAWQKLGNDEKAGEIADRLLQFGKEHVDEKITIDYFAVSLPDLLVFDADLDLRNRIHCLYMMALAWLAKNDGEKAGQLLNEVLSLDINHQGAAIHKNMIGFLTGKQEDAHKATA